MPDLSIGDLTYHYEVTGNGPPLLMLAGMMSDNASWAPLLPLLQDHFTLVCPDNRTTGRTTPVNAPASLNHFAKDALALMQHLGHAKFHVVGHSMGGLIALELLKLAPSALINVTLLASAPLRLQRNVALFETLIEIRRSNAQKDTWLRSLFPWLFAPAMFDDPKAIDDAAAASLAYPFGQSTEAMAHQLEALRNAKAENLCGPYAVPVQSILAEDDLLIPLGLAQPALAGTLVHVVKNAGHSIHWDAPHDVAAVIQGFCKP